MTTVEQLRNKLGIFEHLLNDIRYTKENDSLIDHMISESVKLSLECQGIVTTIAKDIDIKLEYERLQTLNTYLKEKIKATKSERNYENDATLLLNTLERAERSKRTLDGYLQSINESQKKSEEVLGDLEAQREVMETMTSDLVAIDGVARKSQSLLQRMATRALYNKIVLYLIILALIGGIVATIEVLYVKHSKDK